MSLSNETDLSEVAKKAQRYLDEARDLESKGDIQGQKNLEVNAFTVIFHHAAFLARQTKNSLPAPSEVMAIGMSRAWEEGVQSGLKH